MSVISSPSLLHREPLRPEEVDHLAIAQVDHREATFAGRGKQEHDGVPVRRVILARGGWEEQAGEWVHVAVRQKIPGPLVAGDEFLRLLLLLLAQLELDRCLLDGTDLLR